MQCRGYILQATYRIVQGTPIVHVYGRLEDGASFLIRHDANRPSFYIRAADAGAARRVLSRADGPSSQSSAYYQLTDTDLSNFASEPVSCVSVGVPQDAPPLRDRLHNAGIDTFEADVRFAMRYLIDRSIQGACEIDGPATAGDAVTWTFDNPVVRPATMTAQPRTLAFDIETNPREDTLLAISLYGCGADEVHIVDSSNRTMPEHAIAHRTEVLAIQAFCARVKELDPDVLTGWNVIDFDLAMLKKVAARAGFRLRLGRDNSEVRLRPAQGYFGSGQATIAGRVVLDGLDLVRASFIKLEEHSLDSVARTVLGEGKAVQGDVRDRVGEILHNYAYDLPAFALYARTDSRLVIDIIEHLDLVQLAFARAQLTGMTPDRVGASIASFDFLYLSQLRQRGRVAPTVRNDDSRVRQAGGHVLAPVTGIHDNVWVFDFKSLYPSLIRTFNIDPLAFVSEPSDPDADPACHALESAATQDASLIRPPGGGAFRREPAILPSILAQLFPQRAAAKAAGDDVASQAIKILMNSFYGVLGTPACRFHNPTIANAITGTGKYLLIWSQRWFEARGYQVLYGDTDSVFIQSGLPAERARTLGATLADELTRDLAAHLQAEWQLTSHMEMEFEKLYGRLFLPSVRGGDSGARKRYAGLIDHGPAQPGEVQFVGMEVVRRDWTDLAKQIQQQLYARLFADEPVTDYLAAVVQELRAGKLDHLLVYRKGLRKAAASYTANTPPHVVAARKSTKPGRIIAYVITNAGPEPVDALQHPPDLEHYLNKQVRPVAEPVLASLGLNFDQVIGDDRQLGLF